MRYFLPALATPLLRIPPRVSVTFVLCTWDRFHSNTGWMRSQLKKCYWKFINPKLLFLVVFGGLFFLLFLRFFYTRIGKWQLLVDVCTIRQVYLSFICALDAKELEIRLPTGQIFNNFFICYWGEGRNSCSKPTPWTSSCWSILLSAQWSCLCLAYA